MDENALAIVEKKWFKIYWLLFLALCILLIESLFKSGAALGTVLWFTLAESLALSFAKYSTGRINKKALLLCIPIGLINIGHLMFYNASVHIITWPAAFFLFALQLTYLSKPEITRFSELFDFKNIYDLLNTLFANAFVFIQFPFKGLLNFKKESNKSMMSHILVGLLISLPIVGIFVVLFSSADQAFSMFTVNITRGIADNLGTAIFNLILGGVMCIFVSAAFVGANARESSPLSSEKPVAEVNNISLTTILVMVSVVVSSYVVIQFNHWFGNMPLNHYQMDEFSHSARTGFFELVVASCFLLAIIAAVTMISTKEDNKLTVLIKAPLLLLCVCNIVVLYSAVEKMIIYIGRSGITSKRILVLWFIAVIVVGMAGVVVKIIRYSFKTFNFCCMAIVGLVCLLGFCDMDYYIAKNHIYLAEHHKIQNLEAGMLSELSYAAVRPIAEYKNRIENGTSAFTTTKMQDQEAVLFILERELERHLMTATRSMNSNPVMGFNVSRLKAKKIFNLSKPDKF